MRKLFTFAFTLLAFSANAQQVDGDFDQEWSPCKPWDSNGWEVSEKEWGIISEKINGTYGDETRLEGKTRADIPSNRQALLRFLEEKGWLYEQFK